MATNHQGYVLSLVGDDDPVATSIAAPIGTLYQRTDTGALYMKTGAANNAWTELQQSIERQVFEYNCTGAEGDQFAVALPTAASAATYQVQIEMAAADGSANAFKQLRVVSDLNTVNNFTVQFNVPVEAGDVLYVTVDFPT